MSDLEFEARQEQVREDMLDEISKRNNPTPKDGEIVIKID